MRPADYAAAVEASFDMRVYKEEYDSAYLHEFKRAVISSEVFSLPDGGRILPVSTEELSLMDEVRLPYQFTAIAYNVNESFYSEHAGHVYVDGCWYSRDRIFGPGAHADKQLDSPSRFVVFSQHEQEGKVNTKVFQAYTGPAFNNKWYLCPLALSLFSEGYDLKNAFYTFLHGANDLTEENKQGIAADAADELTILQNLLLALSCTNVSAEKVSPGPVKRQMLSKKKAKGQRPLGACGPPFALDQCPRAGPPCFSSPASPAGAHSQSTQRQEDLGQSVCRGLRGERRGDKDIQAEGAGQ